MCGITGILRTDGQPVASATLARMTATIQHRGPDSEGVWAAGPIGFGHRRLAIIDLTASAHQPMTSDNGDLVIVYNGEVYNYLELRLELETAGHRFHSSSDTEVVVNAYAEWGAACLDRFNGMFAFAIWNRRTEQLFLARDRYGVKPLYYYYDGARFVFGSEIKAILAHPDIRCGVSHEALDEYFTFQNILTDRTLFEGVRLLRPGHFILIAADSTAGPVATRYWDYDFSSQDATITFEEATEELRRLFHQAVTRQLVSDVPVACYLSGGMDSGSITAVARGQLGRLTTFTAGFDLSSASGLEMGFDERSDAEFLSNLLKTEHYEMVMHAGDMEHVMPELISHLEDLRVGQCYPNYYVARLAGKFVKVVLSGAGGDELFGGYPWRYYRGLNSIGASHYYENYYDFWQRLVPDDEKSRLFSDSSYRRLQGHSTFDILRGVFRDDMPLETNADFVNASLYFELKTFLHGLLVVEDKMSMAHSLETRVPFLDNDLVEFACRLPPSFKIANLDRAPESFDENDLGKYRPEVRLGTGKRVLRAAMQQVIPARVTDRVKQGFSAPDASWFRGESIDYVNQLLRDPRGRIYEFLGHDYVTQKLDEHTTGNHNHRLLIWSLLSFEWWLRRFMS
ncbi:MAG TPA: asparagine synthase (glutamine-hydrolyzing) [Thermoanaerobaculia bacterium]|nr:asparagine synthase (glutamine-hydrolyzing) [Thermoanaerobaculia bacterium]